MSFTLREALQADLLQKCRLLTGQIGLDHEITWINILEILDDLNHLQKGEFLITTAYNLKNLSAREQEDIIRTMVKQQIAVLAIQTGYYLEEISNTFIEIARKYSLPLLHLPKEISFHSLTRTLISFINKNKTYYYDFREKTRKSLTEALLDGRDLPTLLEVLAAATGRKAIFFDALLQPLHVSSATYSAPPLYCLCNETEFLALDALKEPQEFFFSWEGKILALLFLPVRLGKEIYGYLALDKGGQDFQEKDRIALRQAAPVFSMDFFRIDSKVKAQNIVLEEIIHRLLVGEMTAAELADRYTQLGLDGETDYVVLVMDLESKTVSGQKIDFTEKRRLKKAVDFLLYQYRTSLALTVFYKGYFTVFLPSSRNTDAATFTKQINALLEELQSSFPRYSLQVGIGNCYGNLSAAALSYREALQSLTAIKTGLIKGKKFLFYKDLGAYQLLLEITDQELLKRFCAGSATLLFNYDRQKNKELLKTLQVYLKHININRTAAELFVHRHTVKYRLKKIFELTGIDPFDLTQHLFLQLSIMTLQYLQTICDGR